MSKNNVVDSIGKIAMQVHQMEGVLQSDGTNNRLPEFLISRLQQLIQLSYEFLAITDKFGRNSFDIGSNEYNMFATTQKANYELGDTDQEYYRELNEENRTFEGAETKSDVAQNDYFGQIVFGQETNEPTTQVPWDTAVGQGADKIFDNYSSQINDATANASAQTFDEGIAHENVAQMTMS